MTASFCHHWVRKQETGFQIGTVGFRLPRGSHGERLEVALDSPRTGPSPHSVSCLHNLLLHSSHQLDMPIPPHPLNMWQSQTLWSLEEAGLSCPLLSVPQTRSRRHYSRTRALSIPHRNNLVSSSARPRIVSLAKDTEGQQDKGLITPEGWKDRIGRESEEQQTVKGKLESGASLLAGLGRAARTERCGGSVRRLLRPCSRLACLFPVITKNATWLNSSLASSAIVD